MQASGTVRILLGFVALVACGWLAPTAWAQQSGSKNNKNKNNAVQREKQDVKQAKSKLADAKKQADAAKESLRRANAAREKAIDTVADVRGRVEREHDLSTELVAGRRKSDEARQRYDDLTTPILKKLETQPEYQAAATRRDELKRTLGKLDNGAPKAELDAAEAEYKAALGNLRKLENAAIENDSAARAARNAMNDSQAKARDLIAKRDAAVDSDYRLVNAKRELENAKVELEKAKNKMAQEIRQLEEAQRKLVAEQQQERNAEKKAQQPRKKK